MTGPDHRVDRGELIPFRVSRTIGTPLSPNWVRSAAAWATPMLEGWGVINSSVPQWYLPPWSTQWQRAMSHNLGNTLIGYGIWRATGLAPDASLPSVPHCGDPIGAARYCNAAYRGIFLVLQDHLVYGSDLGAGADPDSTIALFVAHLQIPVVVLSLTVRALTLAQVRPDNLIPGSARLVEALSGGPIVVGARGAISAAAAQSLGLRAREMGCPSVYAFEPKPMRTLDHSRRSLGGAVSMPGAGDHFVQGDGSERERAEFYGRQIDNGCVPSLGGQDYLPRSVFDWKDRVGRSSVHVTTRVHGSVVSWLAGVPALCLAGDVRARDTLEHYGLPLFSGMAYDAASVEQAAAQLPREQPLRAPVVSLSTYRRDLQELAERAVS